MLVPVLLALSAQVPDSGRFAPIARYIEESVHRGAFPGGVVAIGRRDTRRGIPRRSRSPAW